MSAPEISRAEAFPPTADRMRAVALLADELVGRVGSNLPRRVASVSNNEFKCSLLVRTDPCRGSVLTQQPELLLYGHGSASIHRVRRQACR